jgi:predicted hydrocarbon binding protein
VQGVILIGMQRFVRERFGDEFWRTVEAEVNISGRLYLPSQRYPISEVDAVVASVSRHSGMTVPMVLESVGDYVAPDMLGAYANMIEPQWTLLEVLLHSEAIVERAAKKFGITFANSPVRGRAGANGEIVLAYQSSWRICPFLKGLVRGLGAVMDLPVSIEEIRCMTRGSASCELVVKAERSRSRGRMASVPGSGSIAPPKMPADRASSLPSAPRSIPGQPPSSKSERHTPLPPKPDMPAGRTSNLPPLPEPDFSGMGPGNRRR